MKASEILCEQEPTGEEPPITIDESTEECSWIRRPKLTLRHLHRLRLMHELKKLEAAKERKFVSDMYGSAYEESDDKTKDSKSPPKELKPPKPLKPSKYLDKYTR